MDVALLVISSKMVYGGQPDDGRSDLETFCREQGLNVVGYHVVEDEREAIRKKLVELCDDPRIRVVLTLGGTGVRPTDWAPEATRAVLEKEIPGIGEAMRAESLKKIRTAMLSRGTAGIRGHTLIVNLPGSLKGTKENLQVLLPILDHTVQKMAPSA